MYRLTDCFCKIVLRLSVWRVEALIGGLNVRYWPLADIDLCSANVRFWGQSRYADCDAKCLKRTWGGCKQSPGLSFGTFMTRASSSLVKQNSLFLRANTLFLQNNCLFCCVGNFAASQ